MKRLVFTFILAIFCGISAFAYDFGTCFNVDGRCYGELFYTITSSTYPYTVELVGIGVYTSYADIQFGITIPAQVTYNSTTYSVTSIGSFVGYSNLTSVTIPSSVRSIGSASFSSNYLTSVYYTGTIAEWCGITFGSQPLSNAHNLYINNTLVTDLVIPNTVTGINNYAFQGATCLTSVTIPSSVTSIGQYAFQGCSGLSEITIPNSVTSIGQKAFAGCSGLVDMTIPFVGGSATATEASASTLFGYIFDYATSSGTGTIEQSYSYGSSIYAYIPSSLRSVTVTGGNLLYGAFMNCSMLTSVTIPNSVTSIGDFAFYNCSGLTGTLTIPNSVTSIGDYAFYRCSGLTGTLTIPNSVTIIGSGAFCYCSGLTSVTIGNSVTSIGNTAFYGCDGLTDIYANPATPPTLGTENFNYSFISGDDGIHHEYHYDATVWVPCGSAAAYRTADEWGNFSDIRETGASLLSVSSANPQMGTASVTLQPTCSNGNARIVATPNEGYRFVQWNDGNTDNPRSLYVSSPVEYVASFEAIPTYTITAVSADEATGTVTGGGIFYEGETATLTATAAEGYRFATWNDGNTDNPRTITVTGNATYTATFAVFHTITVTTADETQGTASGSGDYAEGSQVEISAIPAEHHHFTQWNDGNTDNPRTITVTSDSTFTAVFAIDQHTVTVASADEAMGTVSEGGTYDYGTEIQISATPAEGYGFVAWNDGNTDNPRTITVTEDITYTATFGAWRTVTVASANETQGTVEGTGEYVEGTTIQITAIPNEHYHFVHWIDEEIPTRDFNVDNPRTITVTGNMTYTAVFAIDRHTVTVESADETMGTVSETGTYDYGTEIQISASARDGYQFVSWNDGNTDNPRTITVVADATYIASFTSVVGIEESAVSEIALFPNPATDILNITSSENISEIEIVNVMAQVVQKMEVNSDNAVCDVEDLKAGVYVVRIYSRPFGSAQGAALRKFVKE